MTKRLHDNPDHWSDIVGMPDDWDKQNLTNLINNFKKESFHYNGENFTGQQWITREVKDAKKQHQQELSVTNEFGVKIKDSEMRIGTAIPNVLWNRIQESYPTMFRDQKHFNWFVKTFPEFRVPGRW